MTFHNCRSNEAWVIGHFKLPNAKGLARRISKHIVDKRTPEERNYTLGRHHPIERPSDRHYLYFSTPKKKEFDDMSLKYDVEWIEMVLI